MKPSSPSTLMTRLKHETGVHHLRLEKLPFFSVLSTGTLPHASYINQLRAFATAFGTLEHETTTILEPIIRNVLGVVESLFVHLLRDLSCFSSSMVPKIIAIKSHADAMAASIRLINVEDPLLLLEYVHVLQGTILGNRDHLPDIHRTIQPSRFEWC